MPAVVAVCHQVDRTTRIVRWARRIGTVLLMATSGVALGNVAHAFWTGEGIGFGLASTGTLTAPVNVSATAGYNSDTVAVSWGAAQISSAGATVGYYVSRTPEEGGASSPACGTSLSALTTVLSCNDLAVADGTYRYVVTAVVGSWTGESAPSAPVTVFAHVGVPSVSVSTTPAPNSNGYNKTTPVTVQFTASDPDGVASITYAVNGGAPVTVNGSTASVSLPSQGTYTVTYSAVDTLGNRSPTGTRVVRIDTTAPAAPTAPVLTAASDTGVSSSDRITNDSSPTFTGTAEPGSTVQLFSDATLVGSATAGLDGTYTVTAGTLLTDGVRAITVKAVDLAGNTGPASTSTSITIDTVAPSRRPGGPQMDPSSDTGVSSSDEITSDTTPTFAGNINAESDGVALYVGTVEIGRSTTAPYSLTSAPLADGVYVVTAKGFDLAGNFTTASGARNVTIDTVPPPAASAPVLAATSDLGASATDGVTNDASPKMTGTNESAAVVALFDGPTQVGTQTTASTTYAINSSTLSDGSHTMTALATDRAGNVGPLSAGTVIVIDTVAPTAPSAPVLTAASDSGSSSSDRVTNDDTPTFTGTATVGTNVTLYDGNTAVGATVNAANGSWTATTDALRTGNRNITARTDPDLAGNVGISPTTTVTIDTSAPGTPAAPSLATASDSGRSNADGITNITTPSFFGNGSPGVVGVLLYDGGNEVGSATASASYVVTASTLAHGTHSVTVRTFDLAGNLSVSSAVQSVVIDTVAPAAPSAPVLAAGSDSGSSSTDRITNVANPTVQGTNESIALVTVYDGATQVGTHTTTSTSYSVTTSTLSDGAHTLTATATDVAGNVGPASSATTITIDTTAPTAPSAPVLAAASDSGVSSSDRITKNTTLTFTGTAASGTTVRLYDGSTATGALVTASGGSWSATTAAMVDGARSITARTEDVAGNVGISPVNVVTVDTAAPTVNITVDNAATVRFAFTFNETVHGFAPSDVSLSGTANPTTSTVTGTGASYFVQVSGMNRSGTVVANLGAAQVTDTAGNANPASTSATNSITYTDATAPTVTISKFQAVGQAALVEGTAGTAPGDPATVTVVLCTKIDPVCAGPDTRATLTASVNQSTGAWSVTSGTLSATASLYARASATDLSGNLGRSGPAGPISIPAAAALSPSRQGLTVGGAAAEPAAGARRERRRLQTAGER